MEVASVSFAMPVLPAPGKAEWPPASVPGTPRAEAATPTAMQSGNTRNDGGITNEDMDSAEGQSLRKTLLPGNRNSAADGEGASTGTNRIMQPESAAPIPDSEIKEASLRIPPSAMPAPLRGSHESLERQNARLDADGLERIEDEADLTDRIEHKLLVPIPASSGLVVNADLLPAHRYCRPWTARFLDDLARTHDAAFHRPLEVSSAVRTVEYQKRLMETNGNAAPAEGDIVSPHLTGATIDIAKDGLSRDEIAWMRRRLLALQSAGKIDVEEEFQQACFHITVYKSYTPSRAPRTATRAKNGNSASKRHKAPASSGDVAAQGL